MVFMISVLYIDKDQILLDSGKRFLESDGDIRVDTAQSLPEALPYLKTSSFDAIIADHRTRETDGIEFLRIIREKFHQPSSIIFTGRNNNDTFDDALSYGADYCVTMTGDPKSRFAELAHIIRQSVKCRENERKILRLNRVYSVLARVSEVIVRFHDRMQLMQEICRIAVQEGGYAMAWIGFEDPATHRIKDVVASGALDDFFVNARISSEDITNGQGPTVYTLRKGTCSIFNDIQPGTSPAALGRICHKKRVSFGSCVPDTWRENNPGCDHLLFARKRFLHRSGNPVADRTFRGCLVCT